MQNIPEPGVYADPLGAPGWQASNYNYSPSAQLQAVSGARWVRITVDWAFLEPYHRDEILPDRLAVYDSQVAFAIQSGMKVMLTLGSTPAWARPASPLDSVSTLPADRNDFAVFAQRMAAHFGALGVHAYEIWNEPNLAIFASNPDPVAYTRMLQAAYPAIKHTDPTATVVAGAVAPVNVDYPPEEFVRGMYAAGAKGSFDVLSLHVFPGGDPTECKRDGKVPYGVRDLCFVEQYRNIQRLNSDKKPIWITEFGYGTGGLFSVSAEQQADYLRLGYKAVRRYRYLRVVIWYSFRDLPPDPGRTKPITWVSNSGLITTDCAPKEAFGTYQRVANRLEYLRERRAAAAAAGATVKSSRRPPPPPSSPR